MVICRAVELSRAAISIEIHHVTSFCKMKRKELTLRSLTEVSPLHGPQIKLEKSPLIDNDGKCRGNLKARLPQNKSQTDNADISEVCKWLPIILPVTTRRK